MPYEQRDNSGSLFKNDRKETSNQPDYTGKCMVNGKMMRMAAWMKESGSGTKYMSFAFSEPREAAQPAPVPATTGHAEPVTQDDIPF